jgi:hypothetical protein
MEHAILGGEVWTDGRGRAVIILPDHLHGRELEYDYELLGDRGVDAFAELRDGRLTIESGTAHQKIAWRLAYRTRQARVPARPTDWRKK